MIGKRGGWVSGGGRRVSGRRLFSVCSGRVQTVDKFRFWSLIFRAGRQLREHGVCVVSDHNSGRRRRRRRRNKTALIKESLTQQCNESGVTSFCNQALSPTPPQPPSPTPSPVSRGQIKTPADPLPPPTHTKAHKRRRSVEIRNNNFPWTGPTERGQAIFRPGFRK